MHYRYVTPGSNPFTRQFAQSPNGVYWEEAAVVETPAGSGTTTTVPATTQDSSTTQPRPAGNAADDEQRRGMIADLQKERAARQKAEQRASQHEADLATERRRIQALVGANPKDPKDAEADAIRARFSELFPNLAGLSDEKIQKLLAIAERGDSLDEATQHHWQAHGRQVLRQLVDEFSEQMGGELTERQQDKVKKAFAQAVEADEKMAARYEAGDPNLLKEFVKEFMEDFYEPARRQVTAGALGQQRRVPNGSGRSAGTNQPQKKIDFSKPKDVEDAMVEAFARHGGAFGD